MPRLVPRRALAASMQHREQNASRGSPSDNSEIQSQLSRNWWSQRESLIPSVVPDTQKRTSGHRHTTTSPNVQAGTSTSAPPSQHSEESPNQTVNHQETQPTILQEEGSDSPSFQSMIKADRVATGHTPAPKDRPPLRLLTAQQNELLKLWTETNKWSRKVVHEVVVQAITSYFSDLKWDQGEPTRSQPSSTGLVLVGATERHPDLENHDSAFAPNNTRGSQHGSKSPRDATGGMLVLREGPSSRLATPGGADVPERNGRGRSKPKGLGLRDLTSASITINNEEGFREAFRKDGLDAIKGDGFFIDLLDLARETVKNAKPKFQKRQQEYERRRDPTSALVDMTNEIWQVLFTIIANMFVFGVDPLYDTVKAMSKQSSTGSSGPARRNPRGPNNAVARHLSQDKVFEIVDGEKLEKLSQSMRWWRSKANKYEGQLGKVHAYYKKLEAVRLYDKLIGNWQQNEKEIQGWLLENVGQYLDAATVILTYIAIQITPSREGDTNDAFDPLPENSEIIQELSGYIFGFRPISSLADTFGDGVLVLLTDRAETHVLGKVGKGQDYDCYPQHQRIRDVAQSLRKVDREQHDGRLRKLFTDLEKMVLNPVLRHNGENVDAGNFAYDWPRPRNLNQLGVGARISKILTQISQLTYTGSDVVTAQPRQRLSKRRTPHNSMQEAVDGEEGRSKRHRNESGQDEESRQDGSESNTGSGEDIYNP